MQISQILIRHREELMEAFYEEYYTKTDEYKLRLNAGEEEESIRSLSMNSCAMIIDSITGAKERDFNTIGRRRFNDKTDIKKIHQHMSEVDKLILAKLVFWKEQDESLYTDTDIIQFMMEIKDILTSIQQRVLEGFMQENRKKVAEQRKEIIQLSTRIIPITATVGVLPIVGTLDDDRGYFMKEKAIESADKLNIDTIVIDFSSAILKDDLATKHMEDMIQSFKLIGLIPILSGMQPSFAQRTIQVGSNISKLDSFGSLEQALKHLGI
ncbi:STAS domain-containing protein [Listeria ivanovii]|uniref:Putative sigma factor regulator n=1 Tax=Listeria ivanovii (strain ATCC BAA-678 / PAM 55) TaxID=881621 RepID=G2ZAC0_LISIP|nr:STAS domain-containing protein [Listeria ivanovii]AHI56147.1 sulfate transporter [Listeria ivanovii WSLC3009]AIS65581.1 sulfate transporter [Listeria ivanovii subsp. ivanovii]MBC1759500.1 STAS domain-containing protein [Listeria ivanovii]MBK3915610.1 STAS domain-containing protein [Listeria ivanovii subsp. ivanovii]MBK3922713.1 STAS domain-containing protein [Listeria ivanovii subsp. ivanovii]